MTNITAFSKETINFELSLDGKKFLIKRIDGNDNWRCFRNSLCIEPNYAFWWEMEKSAKITAPGLAEFYAMFRAAYGESGQCYDDWKGAFSFVFKVTPVDALRVNGRATYLLNAVNSRVAVEFRFRKILGKNDRGFQMGLVFAPFEDEFSRTQMDGVSAYLLGYANGLWKSFPQHTPEFMKRIDSNLVLYGYENGQFFHNQFEDYEAYWEALNAWKLNHA